jgi:hypothetical protein
MPTRTAKFTTTVTGPGNQKPVAVLATYRVDALMGSIIQLDGRKSFDPEKRPLSWKWRFVNVPIGSTVRDSGFRDIRPNGTAVSFIPDKTGVYITELIVNDGELDSDPVTATINIQLTRVPIGENLIPDAQFLWNYISNFWGLVEDREVIASIWSSVVQSIGSDLITLWGTDTNKSMATIQNTFQRRWQPFETSTDLLSEVDQRIIVGKTDSGTAGYTGRIGEDPGLDNTQVFYTSRGTYRGVTETDFTKLFGNYGEKGRVVSVNGEGYTIQRVSNELDVKASGTDLIISGVGQVNSPSAMFENSGVEPGQWLVIKSGNRKGSYKISGVVSQQLLTVTFLTGDPVTFSPSESNLLFEIGWPYTVLVADEGVIPDGQVGIPWRIPNLLHIPSINLESSGVRKGDVLIFDVTRGDLGLSAELRAQIVCVDRSRLGFEFSLGELTNDASEVLERSSIQQLVVDLKIVPPDAPQSEINGAAEAFIAFMPISVNLASRPFTTYRITFKAKKIIHNTFIPFDENLISVPALQEAIKDPPVVLRENLDYIVEDGGITFVGNLFTPEDPAPSKLWAECVILDNSKVIEQNFGRLVNLAKDDLTVKQTRVPYLSAVKGLFFAFINGPTVSNIRLGLQILLGLPFTEERGLILELQDSFAKDANGDSLGRLLVEDVDDKNRRTGFRRFYFYPTSVGLEINQSTKAPYQVGDIIERFVPISKGVDVVDYIKDPYWWKRVLVGLEILKYFTFKVVIDSKIFDSNDVSFALEFVRAIKPSYTQVITAALVTVSDDIEVEDTFGGKITTRFYDNAWGLEATNKSADDNHLGVILWHANSKPFQTRTLHLLKDVQTRKNGTAVEAYSATGWGESRLRSRSLTGTPIVEGDLLVILQGQPGASLMAPGLYEIGDVIDNNTLELLQKAPFTDPVSFDPIPLDENLFEYGEGLWCCIVRRGSNPIIRGDDLSTSSANNTATSAGAAFLTNVVSIGDHLVIESGANKGEYIIDATVPFSPGPPQAPPYFTETQVALLTMDGDVPVFSTATDQDFRVVRRDSQPRMVLGARSVYTGGQIELEVLDPNTAEPFDVFTPRMVGTLTEVSNSEDPTNDGLHVITEYVNSGKVILGQSLSVSSDASAQSVLNFAPPMETSEIRPTERVEIALVGDDTVGVNNRLKIVGASQLGIDPAFVPAGDPYSFEGPADLGGLPDNVVQLGFSLGDQIRLSQASGQPVGSNDGALVTILDPSALTVLEALTFPDTTVYKFHAIKRGA